MMDSVFRVDCDNQRNAVPGFAKQVVSQFGEGGIFKENEITPQLVAHFEKDSVFGENIITQQVVAQIKNGSIPGENVILQQVVAQIGEDVIYKENEIATQLVPQIVSVPWGHIVLIMNHAGQDRKKALFYVTQTVLNNWSRAMLLNFIKSDLYARQGKAVTNFDRSLPEEGSGLAFKRPQSAIPGRKRVLRNKPKVHGTIL